MAYYYLLYSLCLLINTPVILTKVLLKVPNVAAQSSNESLEILPYTASKLGERNSMTNERFQKEKLLAFLNSNREVLFEAADKPQEFEEIGDSQKRKVKNAEAFLSEMLRALQSLFSKKQTLSGKYIPISKQNAPSNIAWSYYDDLGK